MVDLQNRFSHLTCLTTGALFGFLATGFFFLITRVPVAGLLLAVFVLSVVALLRHHEAMVKEDRRKRKRLDFVRQMKRNLRAA